MNRFNLDNFPTPKTKLSSGQIFFLVLLSLGLLILVWYCWGQYDKIQQNRLSKKQKEIDDIQNDNDLTEKALINMGAGNCEANCPNTETSYG